MSEKLKYVIRSKAGVFEDFEYEDTGMGYLDFNLCTSVIPKIIADHPECSKQVKILIYLRRWSYPSKDLLVKPVKSRIWYEIRNRRNSSIPRMAKS